MMSIAEEFKVAKSKLYMTLGSSFDQVIHDTRPDIKTGQKWSVSDAISDIESQLKHKDTVGTTQVEWRGIGHNGMIW